MIRAPFSRTRRQTLNLLARLFHLKTPTVRFHSCSARLRRSRAQSAPRKMVNERSPAKAPLLPLGGNALPPREEDTSYKIKSMQSSVPQFGQPTMPHSPLHRPAQKDSSVFMQPKSRPEHHRDSDRTGIFYRTSSKHLANRLKRTHTCKPSKMPPRELSSLCCIVPIITLRQSSASKSTSRQLMILVP